MDIKIQADYGIKDWQPNDEVILLILKSLVFFGDQIHLELSHSRLRFTGASHQGCCSQEKYSFQN